MEEIVYRAKGETGGKTKSLNGISIKLIMKSGVMEVLQIEMEPGADFGSRYQHRGEEYHFVLSGEVEYSIDSKTYLLKEGDSLWHKSNLSHTAKNVGDTTAVLLDVIMPPSFM